MALNIGIALQRLFPAADPFRDYRVQDDGDGPRIAFWGLPDPQPTTAALQAAYDAWLADQQQASTAKQASDTERTTATTDLRDQYASAMTALDAIINSATTLPESKVLARIVKRTLRLLKSQVG